MKKKITAILIAVLACVFAVAAAKGEAVEDTDTGAQWYTAANMDEPDVAKLLYD